MDIKSYIKYEDAAKISAPAAFTSMLKPVGSECNLDCTYCYYLDKGSSIYNNRRKVMSLHILEEFTRQYIEANDVQEVTFLWHGGEPLLAGLDFFRSAMAIQKKYRGNKTIINTLQTNGTLVNSDWCRFFNDNNFLVGISIDGPREVHDAYRVNKAGRPTLEKVLAAINLMSRHHVEYNTLSVISRLSEQRGVEIYKFLKSVGSRFIQFLPAVDHFLPGRENERPVFVRPGTPGSVLAPWSVSALGYGSFMTDIFDEWLVKDVGSYFVQAFDMTLAQWVGAKPGLCICSETCGDVMAVEHNGDVYPCDHFVYPGLRLGNVMNDELKKIYHSRDRFDFGIKKRAALPRNCIRCDYYFACRGECPNHRFSKTEDGEEGLSSLCEGFKLFYSHVSPYMDYMKNLLLQEKPPSLVMEWARMREKKYS